MGDSTKLLKQFRSGYISVSIYCNTRNSTTYYDTVVHRKCRGRSGSSTYIRGANLKPSDLKDLIKLLKDAEEYLVEHKIISLD